MEQYNISKVAVITGGARGIGRAISEAFVTDGYRIAIIYNSSVNEANELVHRLNADGELRAIAVKCNVANSIEVDKAITTIIDVFGVIDVLINNAGIAQSQLLMDTTNEDWRRIMSVDLDGAFYMCRKIVPIMLNTGGAIINVSSVWGIVGGAMEVAYSSAKAGMIGLTRALSKELAYNKITVNAVAPGVIDTDMMKCYNCEEIDQIIESTPLRRLGTAEEVAEGVLFLAKAKFITGEVLSIDGGYKG